MCEGLNFAKFVRFSSVLTDLINFCWKIVIFGPDFLAYRRWDYKNIKNCYRAFQMN